MVFIMNTQRNFTYIQENRFTDQKYMFKEYKEN